MIFVTDASNCFTREQAAVDHARLVKLEKIQDLQTELLDSVIGALDVLLADYAENHKSSSEECECECECDDGCGSQSSELDDIIEAVLEEAKIQSACGALGTYLSALEVLDMNRNYGRAMRSDAAIEVIAKLLRWLAGLERNDT